MRVLFVDDDPNILAGLRRALFDMPDDWEVAFSPTALAGLEQFKLRTFDVVVTDMRMPGMDGATFLKEIAALSPATVRIVLSGWFDEADAFRSIGVAHQFLSKPCQADTLVATIARAVDVRRTATEESVLELTGRIKALPPAPRVYAELTRLLASADVSVDEVTRVVSRDPAITGALLRVATSAFFGRGARVPDVKAAIVRLGLRLVRALAVSTEVFGAVPPAAVNAGFSVDGIHRRAMKRAALVERLATPGAHGQDTLLAATLSELGVLVLAMAAPDRLAAALTSARMHDVSLAEVERRLHGITHARFGGYLLGIWGFSPELVDAIGRQHDGLPREPISPISLATLLFVANQLMDKRPIDEVWLEKSGVSRSAIAGAKGIAETDDAT